MVTVEQAEADPREHLGRDLFISADDDLIIDTKDDLAQIRYGANLIQSLVNRLRTQIGELELHPNYGSRLPEIIGTNATTSTLSLIQLHVRESLLQEPRVDEILSIVPSFRDVNNQIIDIGITVSAINQLEPLNLIYSLFL